MVEFALVSLLYLILVFGIIEFVMAVYHWSQVVKGAREGVRYAIVNDPVCDPYGLYTGMTDCSPVLECEAGATVTTASCTSANCTDLLVPIRSGGRQDIASSNVTVTYSCTGLELPDETPIPLVTITIQDVAHKLYLPKLFGFESTWTIPDVRISKTGEDLCTAGGPKPYCRP